MPLPNNEKNFTLRTSVVEFLQSLVYSIDIGKNHDGAVQSCRVYLEEFETKECPSDIGELIRVVADGGAVDGAYNVANLVRARGKLLISRFKSFERTAPPDCAITITLAGELILAEPPDIDELLSIMDRAVHRTSINPYSIDIRKVENSPWIVDYSDDRATSYLRQTVVLPIR